MVQRFQMDVAVAAGEGESDGIIVAVQLHVGMINGHLGSRHARIAMVDEQVDRELQPTDIARRTGKFRTLQQVDKRTSDIVVAVKNMQIISRNSEKWSDNRPIKFIDTLDRRTKLPYEWCKTWEVSS